MSKLSSSSSSSSSSSFLQKCNKRIFYPNHDSVISVEEVNNLATKFFYCVGRVKLTSGKSPAKVRWEKPKPNWIKLNTNGSALDNPSLPGGGGIL